MTAETDPFAVAMQLHGEGRAAEAEHYYRESLRLNPRRAAAHNNLAMLLQDKGDVAGARMHYEQALRAQPDFLPGYNNLGNLLLDQGDTAGALANYREALRLDPDSVEALNNCGKLLHDQGKVDEALEYYDRALRLNPAFAAGHFNRAALYDAKGEVLKAIAGYREAWRLNPQDPSPCLNLAGMLTAIEQPDEAIEYCRKALDAGGDSAMLRQLTANALRAMGRVEEAVACFRASLDMQADPARHSNLLYELNFHSGYDLATTFAEHLAWARLYAEPLTVKAPPHANDPTPHRRLRVGYVSAHFRDHAISYFTEPLLAAHDRKRFETFCYYSWPDGDDVTRRLQASVDHWRNVHELSDEQLANQVRADGIDILVDLTGHIGDNRLLVFARKPAPIQVTYLGYQNTTGLSAMDYRLTDERADPPDLTDQYYTERLVRLPCSFFCYRPDEASPPVSPLPALAEGHVTFGSFNLFAKVTAQVIETWVRILARVPDSRLIVLASRGGYAESQFRQHAKARGIDPHRIRTVDRRPRADYMRLVQQVDIALDPFPFNGHTTTCDAIWLGVPVVTLAGQMYASRFGGSVLANVGLEHLITHSPEHYADTAVALAGDLPALAELRGQLRPRMAESALLDFAGFARNVEDAYRKMWTDWCKNK